MTDTKNESFQFLRDLTGQHRAASPAEIVTEARSLIACRMRCGTTLTSPRAAQDFLTLRFAHLEHEVFAVLFLDTRHRLIDCRDLFRGTVDGASVCPREVVKEALAKNAAAVILAHNHPSGVAEPSQADEIITTRIRDALALVEIRVLDHLIVAGSTVTSLAERGVL